MKKKKETEASRPATPDWKIIAGVLLAVVILILIFTGKVTPSKINIFGVELDFVNPTNTPIAAMSATPIPPTLTRAPTEIILPTDTLVPSAIASEMPTLIPSSTSVIGKTIFEDTFLDNRNKWFVVSGFPNIVAGKYTHKVSCLSTNPSFYCTSYVVTIPFKFPRNFHLEVDAKILELSSGGKVAIGFQVRRGGAGYYQFNYFITDGSFQLDFVSASGNPLTIIPETSTELMHKDLEAANTLGVEINNSLLVPIINGNELPQAKDGSLLNAGGAYLTIFTSRETMATVQISKVTVQEVP